MLPSYSLHSQNQSFSRTTAVAFILALHAAVLIAFNSGIGTFLFTPASPPFKYVDVKPEPKPYEFAPPPETPPVIQPPALQLTPVDVGKVTSEENIVEKNVVKPPLDGAVGEQGTGEKTLVDAVPVARLAIAHRVDPVYPASAERAGEEGTVLLEIEVDTLGRVMTAHLARSSGFNALDKAAILAVREWRFTRPATIAKVRVPITFKLSQRL